MQLKLDNSKIYAIALEGGGAKGSYEVGSGRPWRRRASAITPCPAPRWAP